MYTSFYNLDKKPFEMNPDPSFLWLGEKHKNAFSTLLYGILDNKGFLLLTGAAGCGKTTLLKALTLSLEKDVEWAVITDPNLDRIDFYNVIARGFGIKTPFSSKVQFLIQFSHFLHKADEENKKVLLLVDDCHLLSQEMLEELRLLSNIEKADAKLINIFFVGQPEFNDLLSQPKNRALQQRLALVSELPSLDVSETDAYIRHRLKIAGTEEVLFAPQAVQLVHRFGQGVPRRINAICDQALALGFAQSLKVISDKVIEACVQKMDLPAPSGQDEFDTFADNNSDQKQYDERFIPKPAAPAPSFSGFNLESDNRGSWLKYGLGIFVLLIAGIYFWFPWLSSLESAQKEVAQKALVEITKAPESVPAPQPVPEPEPAHEPEPVMKAASPVGTSPALTMLGENRSEINGKKAADLRTAILERAYSADKTTEETKNLHAEATSDEIEKPDAQVEQKAEVADISKVEESADQGDAPAQVLAEEKPLPEETNTKDTDVTDPVVVPTEVAEEVLEVPSAEPQVEKLDVVKIAPMEPRKITLGLQPNSLKLTNGAKKEFDSFVMKLKLYPRATVQIRGFVSAKNNSPENIKLSEDRALSVQKLMLAKGIDPEQIEVVGMGNQEPIASNNTREGRKKNRRVEIIVINDGI